MSHTSGTSGIAYQPYVPKPKDLSSEIVPTDFPKEVSWRSLETFMMHRSFRRIFYFAGSASVIFAAWYLYRRLTDLNDELIPDSGSTSSMSASDSVEERESIDEPVNNNAILPTEKMTPPPAQPKEDKVVIHCCPRGFFVPSIATEPLKLETFLRVANIPYEVNFCNEYEAPFLTYGDKIGNDFRESVRILSEKFDVDLEKEATASRKTAAHLVDISLENHFSWGILIWRWIFDEGKSMKKIHAMNALGEEVVPEVSQRVKDATKFHPIGQMDKTEFMKTINQGIHDLAAALGKHKYFQGQAPGLVDCHAFAILIQIMWNMPGSQFDNHLKKYANLVEFIKRMKEKYWPDWNELILKPKQFEEKYSAMLKHHRTPSKQIKRTSRSRDREQGDKTEDKGTSGSDEEAQLAPTTNKLVDLEAGLPKKVNNLENTNGEHETSAAQPPGILKAGNSNNTNVGKPRSGIVNASPGSIKFPVDEVNNESAPALNKNTNPGAPPSHASQQPQNQPPRKQDSMLQVHKPSVKFANETDSATVHQQFAPAHDHLGNSSNGNNGASPLTQRPPAHYPGSLSELSRKKGASEQRLQQSEQVRQSMPVQPDPYSNYAQQQPPQRPQQMQQQNPGVDEYRRSQQNRNSTHAQHFHQAPASPPPTYGQSTYPVSPPLFNSQPSPGNPSQMYTNQQASGNGPQMYNNQPAPGDVPISYPQQIHYTQQPQQMGHPVDDGLRLPPPFSTHHQLNPDQMQKAAQAHLDAYLQHQQHQQYQQQQQYNNNNYHTNAGIVPSFIAPQFDPRNPASSLLRY